MIETMVNLLNANLSVKSVIGILVAVAGVGGGAIKLTDWAEHRVTSDEQAVVDIATSVGEIKAAVRQQTDNLVTLDKVLAVQQKEQTDWEAKVEELGNQVARIMLRLGGFGPGSGGKVR